MENNYRRGDRGCIYCNGRGLATSNIVFDHNRNIVTEDIAITCHCAPDNVNNLVRMKLNEKNYNRTEIKSGFILVFSSITKKEEFKAKYNL